MGGGCRVFDDYSLNPHDAQGNAIKFDFSFGGGFGGEGGGSPFAGDQRRFSQHVLMSVDLPAGGAARWDAPSGGASVQTLFSAFACDSGAANQPPVFVASQHSRSTEVETEFRCWVGAACRIALHARDFAMDASGVASGDATEDMVRIEPQVLGASLGAERAAGSLRHLQVPTSPHDRTESIDLQR